MLSSVMSGKQSSTFSATYSVCVKVKTVVCSLSCKRFEKILDCTDLALDIAGGDDPGMGSSLEVARNVRAAISCYTKVCKNMKGKVKNLTLEWFCREESNLYIKCCTVLHLLYCILYYALKFRHLW
jgi:hypothetical protein